MARISTYPVDKNITGTDILLGTDATGGVNATKNFLISDLSLIVINDYLYNNSWKFTDNADGLADQTKAAIYFENAGGNNTPWANISTIRVQLLMGNNTNAQPYLQYLLTNDPVTGQPSVNNRIKITDRNDLSSFAIFTFTSLVQVTGKTDIYDIGLTFIEGYGAIENKHLYGINIDTSDATDKTFIFDKVTPGTVWNVAHNLAKFPSITVIDSANTVVTGQYTYIDNNNVTLTFSAAFTGKAYLN
tara:strand:- start:114 stop:851 length:738 start_codon:yes stop_codon:yes gene_type:complete